MLRHTADLELICRTHCMSGRCWLVSRLLPSGDLAYFPGGAAGCGGGMISDTLLTFSRLDNAG